MSPSEVSLRPVVPILYGTETGNSQDLAEMLSKRLRRLKFLPKLYNLDSYPVNHLPSEPIVLFICATAGQGELPRNSKKFWRSILKKKLPPTLLEDVRFSTFGLGDSSYPHYNWAVKKLHARLLNLGAKELSDRGEGDEQNANGIEKMYQEWENKLCENLEALYPLPDGVSVYETETLLSPVFPITIHSKKPKRLTKDIKGVQLSRQSESDKVYSGRVVKNDRITAKSHFQDVRHLVLDTEEEAFYDPGDTIALYPTNDPKDVQELLDDQGWDDIADYKVSVIPEFEETVFGGLVSPLTVRSLLTHHLDIMAIPRRSFFASTWYFSEGLEHEREKLQEFSTVDGLDELYDYANRPRRSILETITEFSSLKIPIEYILDVFPVLRPRLFSIASPQNQSEIELSIAIVKYKTIIRRIRRGVCTRYISGLEPNDAIPFSIHRNGLYTPKSYLSNTRSPGGNPLILIATGTGVAPVISIVRTLLTAETPRKAPIYVFFGCRGAELDFHFKNEWKELVETHGKLLKVYIAFSRDSADATTKKSFEYVSLNGVHVQALLYEHKTIIGEQLNSSNSVVYLCGSSGSMPRLVRVTLKTIIEETLEIDEKEAENRIFALENSGRFIQETW